MLADTTFKTSHVYIPTFKTDAAYHQDPDKIKFNNAVSPPRVITEHTMSHWKGHFPWLRSSRMRITNDKKSLKKILCCIDAIIVLHNVLIEFGDGDDPVAPWDIEEELSDIGNITQVPERDVLDLPLPKGSVSGQRHEQLKNYIRETWFWWHPFGSRLDDESNARCTRETLDKITAAIKNKEVFAQGTRDAKQIPVKQQLMVLLHFLGKEGENNESQRQVFNMGYGTNNKYRVRVVQVFIDI